ncbi:MAG: hypothetical protein M3M95_03250 [Pseudomonadota bacterium]|nr:hypothetical protein [Pseudomonadota bacterium]
MQLTREELHRRIWTFGRPGEWPIAHHVQFHADGSIGGFWDTEEVSWTIADGRLVLLDRADQHAVVFDDLRSGAEGRLAWAGRARNAGEGSSERVLMEIEPFGALCPPPSDLEIRTREGRRRRNLLVLPAGEASLHPTWPRDVSDEERNWDLCVSFYGKPENFGHDDFAEHQVLQPGARKFEALYRLFHEQSPFWDYDFIAFPDDDLMLGWRDWNTLFAACRRFGLDLAQPSITGYPNQPIVHPNPDYFLRYVSWVEIMTPIFSNRALRLCAPTLAASMSGYGLDHVWAKLLGEPENRIAIIDAVSAVHTRPGNTGTSTYNYEVALREGFEIQRRYGAPWRTVEFGGVRRKPRVRPPAGHPEES